MMTWAELGSSRVFTKDNPVARNQIPPNPQPKLNYAQIAQKTVIKTVKHAMDGSAGGGGWRIRT